MTDCGYIRLWRKSLKGGLIKNHNAWIFWTWCLLKANHKKDHKQTVGFQEVILQPGEFIFGRKKAAEETGLSERNIRTCVDFLRKCQNLTIKPTNKFSVISITNWETYQFTKQESDQQSDQPLTSKRPASDHKQEHINKRINTPLNPPKGNVSKLKDYLLENIPTKFNGSKEKIIEFFKYRQQKPKAKKYQTEKGVAGLLRDLSNCHTAGYDLNICLDIAMERNWQTPSVDYFKPEMFPKKKIPVFRVKSEEEIQKESDAFIREALL
jgi:hypothetical protein